MIKEYTVYKHTSPSGKVYIGITKQSPPKRWKDGFGYRQNVYFWKAIVKYGWDNIQHEILFTGLTKEEAEQKEIELIAHYKSNNRDFGYNINNGGNTTGTHSEETRRKMSDSGRGKHIGKKASEATKLKMSQIRQGTNRGENNPMYGKRGPLNPNYGKHLMGETKLKISQSNKGKGNKKVLQYSLDGEFIKEWDSLSDVGRELGIIVTNISRVCRGKRKSTGGYVWRYVDVS